MGYITKLDFEKDKNEEKIILALGFFDAIHKGHKKIIDKTIKLATKLNIKPAIFTFRNINTNLLKNKKNELFSYEKRIDIYSKLGLKVLIYVDVTDEFCNLEPEIFFEKLINNFNIDTICVGKDYSFGKRKKGDIYLLKKLTKKYKINLKVINLLKLKNKEEKISSTYIKKNLKKGNVEEVNKLLTDNYSIKEKVVKGKQLGRKLGFPTANFDIKKELFLKDGVYITKTEIDSKIYHSITNVGHHPTIDNLKSNIETHIFDFDKDIYEKEIKVIFLKRIRDITKFDSIDLLKNRLEKDKNIGKKYFEENKI